MNKLFLKKRLQAAVGFVLFLAFVTGTLIGVLNLKVVREFLSRASGEKADLIIDVSRDIGPMQYPWRNLAQGGEAFDWNLETIVPKVKPLQPQYIRIDHIYDFYDIVKKDGGGQLTFDFSKLDKVLTDITATGAKPFIALSYMPPAISSGDIVSTPTNWNDWQLTIQRTIEHVSGTRGLNDVYYEVWNEPDLFGGWKRSGDKNYLTMYTYAARGAAAARGVKPFKIGGPAITALYKNWLVDFLNHTSKNNLRMDFFSWHRYNMNISQFERDIEDAKLWMQDFPQYSNLELVISEWGHDSNVHGGYDTSFGAVHTVATAIQMVGSIDKAFVFEIEDGKDPAGQERWGRWGLMTHQSFGAQPKPRYNALRFLDRIGPIRLDLLGKGTWVKALASRNDKQEVQVMLANYDPQGANLEVVPITFVNIKPGEYQLKQTSFGGGNNFTDSVATTSSTLRTFVTMPVNSIALLEMIPQFAATPSAVATGSATATQSGQVATPSASPSVSPTLIPFATPRPATSGATPRTGFGRLIEP